MKKLESWIKARGMSEDFQKKKMKGTVRIVL